MPQTKKSLEPLIKQKGMRAGKNEKRNFIRRIMQMCLSQTSPTKVNFRWLKKFIFIYSQINLSSNFLMRIWSLYIYF